MLKRVKRYGIRCIAVLVVLALVFCGVGVYAQEAEQKKTPSITASSTQLYEGQTLQALLPNFSAYVQESGTTTVVPGSFRWAAGVDAGKALSIGTYYATVEFTPQDGSLYETASREIAVKVVARETSDDHYETAEEVEDALSGLTSSDKQEVNALAEDVRSLSQREKKRLSDRAIRRLNDLYTRVNDLSDEIVVVVDSDYSSGSSDRMPRRASYSYGANVAADGEAVIELEQERATGKEEVRFTASIRSGGDIESPVIFHIALPDSFRNTGDFILRNSGSNIPVDINRSGGQYYAVFTAYSLDGAFRLLNDEDDRYDNRPSYRPPHKDERPQKPVSSAFWNKVAEAISLADEGDRVRVNIGSRATVPADVLRHLYGRNVVLSMERDKGERIDIYGKNMNEVASSRTEYTVETLSYLYGPLDWPAVVGGTNIVYVPQNPPVNTAPAPPAVTPPAPEPPASSQVTPSIPEESQDEESSSEAPQEESDAEESEPEIVIDKGAADDELPPKPQESTGAQEDDPILFAAFIALAIAFAAFLAAVITFGVWNSRKRRRL